MDTTIITAIIGAIATIITALIGRQSLRAKDRETAQIKEQWKEYIAVANKLEPYQDINYGIRIISPKEGAQVGEYIEVTGVYTVMPPPDTLRLFTVNPTKTIHGEHYWPQSHVTEFSPETKTWRVMINIGDPDPVKKWSIIAAIVGQSTIILWNYYYKVGPQVGWWDFEGWPTDSRICYRVDGIRRM